MATTAKKTVASSKKVLSDKAKKSTTKKLETEAVKRVKASATTPLQKEVVKSPAVKAATKKSMQTKIAPPMSTPIKQSPAKKSITGRLAGSVSPEERYKMIASAAYFLSEHRGFARGYEMQDWITAEAEIDAKLAG